MTASTYLSSTYLSYASSQPHFSIESTRIDHFLMHRSKGVVLQ
jgi:hypothetical protein